MSTQALDDADSFGIPPVPLPHQDADGEAAARRRRAINHKPLLDGDKDAAPLDETGKGGASAKEGRGRGRRLIICVLLLVVLIVAAIGALWMAFGASKKNQTVRVSTETGKKSDTPTYASDDEKYSAAIANLAAKDGSKDNLLALPPPAASSGIDPQTGKPVTDKSGLSTLAVPEVSTDSSPGRSPQDGGRIPTEPLVAVNDESAAPRLKSEASSRATAPAASTLGRSTLFSTSRAGNKPTGEGRGEEAGTAGRNESSTANKKGVPIPSFGSMLPVRTLGMIYTIRSTGSLVRFELTRDMAGQGWSMKKGTVVIGVIRSAENDRAFISMVGFIEAETGGFVKVTGDLLSGDGASGIKGKKKKVSNGFSRVLSKFGDAGLSILGTLAAGAGRGTIVITDAYSRGVAPITSELSGVLGSSNRREFIEIKAGTPCYVMVTQLPDEIHGVDALASMPASSIDDLTDAEKPRRATGISESQMAELISSGDEAQIRAALPKMTAEMRRVAQAVIAAGGDK